MTQLAMDLPEDVFSALRLAPREFATEIAGISRVAFVDELRRRHVPAIQVDVAELDAELSPTCRVKTRPTITAFNMDSLLVVIPTALQSW